MGLRDIEIFLALAGKLRCVRGVGRGGAVRRPIGPLGRGELDLRC